MMRKPSKMTRNCSNNLSRYLVTSECLQTHYLVDDRIYAQNGEKAKQMVSDLSGELKLPVDVNPA